MSERATDEEVLFEHDPKGAFAQFVAPIAGYGVIMASLFRPTVTKQYLREPACVIPRFHDRHQLDRYDDGLEKYVDCKLCAWTCPANAIFVETAPNMPKEQCSAGERYGRVYQINYLRYIFYDICIEACPTHTLTMTSDFEIAKYTQEDDIYEKKDLLVPLSDGMLAAPHPMVEGKSDVDYYRGEITGPAAAQVNWIAGRHPDDPSLKTVRVAEETY